MEKRLKELIKHIKEVALASEDRGEIFEHNLELGYIVMDISEDESYMFQNDESYQYLIGEYEVSCVTDYVTLEEYIRWSSQGW